MPISVILHLKRSVSHKLNISPKSVAKIYTYNKNTDNFFKLTPERITCEMYIKCKVFFSKIVLTLSFDEKL